jgi:alpha-tubulin suppressor-like RCC1 family protein
VTRSGSFSRKRPHCWYPTSNRMGNSNSPPTSKNRKRSYSDMADNAATEDDSSDESITDIQTDLQAVENRLSSPDRAMSHGRAVFDSIGSALGRIRSRMQAISPSNNTSLSLPAAASAVGTTFSRLTERLHLAERAHSARVPLGILRSEISRRESASSSTANEDSSSPENSKSTSSLQQAVGAKEQQAGIQGQSSTLVASRKYAESHEEIEVVFNEGLGILKQVVEDPILHEEMVHSDRGEFDVLLSATTMKKLDSSRNLDILLQSQSSPISRSSTTVYTWGGHVSMYLSDESLDGNGHEKQVNRKEPHPIPPNSRIGRSNVVSVAVSENYVACATSTGTVLVCGDNSEGAVDPSQRAVKLIEQPMHLEILSMTQITQVSAGIDHVAALTETRSVLTWGNNQDGQLGQTSSNSEDRRFRPPAAMKLFGRRVAEIACGHRFTLILTTRMEVLACGREEITGYSTLTGPLILPKEIAALEGLPLVHMAAGIAHAVVVTSGGISYAWGTNHFFQCGREFPRSISVPLPIAVGASSFRPQAVEDDVGFESPFPNWGLWKKDGPIALADDVAIVNVACGGDHTILCTRAGQLFVTGSNQQGQLGLENKDSISSAAILNHPDEKGKFVSAEAGSNHTLLLDDAGDVWHMGDGSNLRKVLSGCSVTTIAAGGAQNVAIVSTEVMSDSILKAPPGLESLLDGILSETQDSDFSSIKELVSQTEELFRYPSVMNSLFLDPLEMEELYAKLIAAGDDSAVRQRVISAVEKGMTMALESAQKARFLYPESVRFLLLFLQCPLFHEVQELEVNFDARGGVIMALCETILGLPFEGCKALMSWAASVYGKKFFVPFLVKPMVAQLNNRVEKDSTGAPVIAGVLKWLHNASMGKQLAKASDFHCKGIDGLSMEVLFEDLYRFKNASKVERSGNFFFCANPFLLSPRTKRNLLHVENQMTMIKAAQSTGVQFDPVRREYLFQPYYVLAIDREYMLQQTLQAVGQASPGDLRKSLKVVFKGEDGIDAGGVTKEFFQLLTTQLFNVNSGMWSMGISDANFAWFNSDCVWNFDGYYLVGVLVGLAVYNSVLLDVHFPPAVYRKLLRMPLGLEDMVDEDIRNGLEQLLDYEGDDVEDIFCMTFEVNWMDLGTERRHELKPGGARILVTKDNKEEYVLLYTKWLLVDSVKTQYDEFERGFMRVMEGSSLGKLLEPDELELLVVGTPELDFTALEAGTIYDGGFDKDTPVVQSLWRFVKTAPRETQLRFLKFCTGSARSPIGGLGELPFKVQRYVNLQQDGFLGLRNFLYIFDL